MQKDLGSAMSREKHIERNSQAGASLLETALILPILLLLFLGAMDFARAFYAGIELANAATAGAEYGAQSLGKSVDYAGMIDTAKKDAQDLSGMTATATSYCACPDGTQVNCQTGSCPSYGIPQVYVSVTTQYTWQAQVPYAGVPGTVNLQRTVVLRVE